MALKAEETRIVTIDGQARAVETLPENTRRLVNFYDDWKQREVEARSTLLMAQTAMRGLANEIVASIQQAEAEEAGTEDVSSEPEAATAESDEISSSD